MTFPDAMGKFNQRRGEFLQEGFSLSVRSSYLKKGVGLIVAGVVATKRAKDKGSGKNFVTKATQLLNFCIIFVQLVFPYLVEALGGRIHMRWTHHIPLLFWSCHGSKQYRVDGSKQSGGAAGLCRESRLS